MAIGKRPLPSDIDEKMPLQLFGLKLLALGSTVHIAAGGGGEGAREALCCMRALSGTLELETLLVEGLGSVLTQTLSANSSIWDRLKFAHRTRLTESAVGTFTARIKIGCRWASIAR